jgi:hypothetical protein
VIDLVDLTPDPGTVKDTVTTASIVTHVKNNRIEYLLLIGLLHLLGISDRVFTHAAGMC